MNENVSGVFFVNSRILLQGNIRDGATYRFVNLSLVASFSLFVCLILGAHFMGESSCWLRKIANKECILCGCTRDFISLFSGEMPKNNEWSLYIFFGLFLELIWRVFVSVVPMGKRVVYGDIIFHSFMMIFVIIVNFKNIF